MTPADNHLLRRLPSGELSRLINGGSGGLEKVYPERDEVLCHVGKVFEHVFFPVTNVVSLLAILDDKRSVAFSPIGREGVVGTIGLNRQQGSPMRCVQTISGDCYSIPATTIGDLLPECPVLAESLARWQETVSALRVRTAVCHKHHSVQQRICRWLLELGDRCGNEQFMITQSSLGEMLGANRTNISRIVAPLQRRGIIDYLHGDWEILKRPKLESLSCECYRISQEIYRSIMHKKP